MPITCNAALRLHEGMWVLETARRVDKPWGYEIWWSHTDLYAGKILHLEAGHRLSLQYHEQKDESCYLLSGSVRLIKGPSLDELGATDLGPGATWRNLPGEIHTIEGLSASDVLEVSTPQLDDVVRLLDDYGRTEASGPEVVAAHAAPVRMVDREQLALRLSLPRSALDALLRAPGAPQPIGYFRGRLLWEETAAETLRHAHRALLITQLGASSCGVPPAGGASSCADDADAPVGRAEPASDPVGT
jgi:mannose-6-phosphate isomerase